MPCPAPHPHRPSPSPAMAPPPSAGRSPSMATGSPTTSRSSTEPLTGRALRRPRWIAGADGAPGFVMAHEGTSSAAQLKNHGVYRAPAVIGDDLRIWHLRVVLVVPWCSVHHPGTIARSGSALGPSSVWRRYAADVPHRTARKGQAWTRSGRTSTTTPSPPSERLAPAVRCSACRHRGPPVRRPAGSSGRPNPGG
ncbi:hypothetical protein BN12_1960003 [Nostocoides japonicum T1-X7]|uniref:Uncharacterized protein n=1 Tax=Nostocoides japonicum T1-X7 TaxID=1194083 RepID=A0A077LZN9_9MICO|nr:hypothetical protein BN12_1960003 [Tetrasphaera japonica T1-X7]